MSSLTLTLETIDYKSPRTAYFRCVDTKYEEVYDWLVRASTGYYLVRLKNIGWVRFEDAKMVEDFLEENYL